MMDVLGKCDCYGINKGKMELEFDVYRDHVLVHFYLKIKIKSWLTCQCSIITESLISKSLGSFLSSNKMLHSFKVLALLLLL
jgi:hypothetical protein